MAETALATVVRESLWLYPTLLTVHAVCMAVVVGLMLMISLRVLGFAKAIPIASLDRLYPIVWIGFVLNLMSGSMLFIADAPRFVTNIPFLIKMFCIFTGLVLAWLLSRAVTAPSHDDRNAPPAIARVIAMASLVVWVIAIAAGRLTAYL